MKNQISPKKTQYTKSIDPQNIGKNLENIKKREILFFEMLKKVNEIRLAKMKEKQGEEKK